MQVCSCALSRSGKTLAVKEINEPHAHASKLTILIRQLLEEMQVDWNAVDAIAVSGGPGSYTGLRIGVSTAKGLCYALDKPLIRVSTLKSMASGFIQKYSPEPQARLVPMIDARRREVYQAVIDTSLQLLQPVAARIIDRESFDDLGTGNPVYLFGSGAGKFAETFSDHPSIRVFSGFEASADYMSRLASEKYEQGDFQDVAYFEPFYLKDFVATTPRKK